MTKRNNEEIKIAICDCIAGGERSIKRAALRYGVTGSTVLLWSDDASVTVSSYAGEYEIPFKRAVALARETAAFIALTTQTTEAIVINGAVQYQMTEYAHLSDDERELLGLAAYVRDGEGQKIVLRRAIPRAAHEIESYITAAAREAEPSSAMASLDDETIEPDPEPIAASAVLPDNDGATAEPEAPQPDGLSLSPDEVALLQRAASPRADIRDMAGMALAKIRAAREAPFQLDNYGPGREPASRGSVVR